MQITIVVEDKTVIYEGVAVALPDVDWSVFDGDPSTKWDDVAAVQFDPSKANGLDPALKSLAGQPFGMVLLAVVAIAA